MRKPIFINTPLLSSKATAWVAGLITATLSIAIAIAPIGIYLAGLDRITDASFEAALALGLLGIGIGAIAAGLLFTVALTELGYFLPERTDDANQHT